MELLLWGLVALVAFVVIGSIINMEIQSRRVYRELVKTNKLLRAMLNETNKDRFKITKELSQVRDSKIDMSI